MRIRVHLALIHQALFVIVKKLNGSSTVIMCSSRSLLILSSMRRGCRLAGTVGPVTSTNRAACRKALYHRGKPSASKPLISREWCETPPDRAALIKNISAKSAPDSSNRTRSPAPVFFKAMLLRVVSTL